MQLTSPAFTNDQPIPDAYTAKGQGMSPPLHIESVPPGTQSLALIVTDPDAPGGDFTHWTMWNISSTTAIIPEGRIPSGVSEGLNDFNTPGYGAPKPPSGTHRYEFKLYALNTELNVQPGCHPYAFTASLEGHVLAKAKLIGTVTA